MNIITCHSTADGKWRHQRQPGLGIFENTDDAEAYLAVLSWYGVITPDDCSIYQPDLDEATPDEIATGELITHDAVVEALEELASHPREIAEELD